MKLCNQPFNVSFFVRSSVTIIMAATFLSCSGSTDSTQTFQLSTTSLPEEGGSVSPASGNFNEDSEIQLQASANENWIFDGWDGDQTGSQNPVTVTMDRDKSIQARFVKRQFPLTINYDGEGTVTETIVQAKTTDYDAGSVIELEAFSGEGYNFGQWTGDIESMDNPVQIAMDGPKEVTAVFDLQEFNVQIRAEGPGSVSIDPDKEVYLYNDMVTLTAVPDDNIQFLGWFNDSGSFEMLEPVFEYQIQEDLDIAAYFNTVSGGVVVQTEEIQATDGKVEQIVFFIFNYLLEDITLIGADVDDQNGEEFGTLRYGSPPVLEARTVIETRVDFEGDLPNENTIGEWVFTWLFDFKDERYEKSQEVGEPTSSKAKHNPLFIENRNPAKSVSIEWK